MTRLLVLLAFGFLPLVSFAHAHEGHDDGCQSAAVCHEDGTCSANKKKAECPCCDEVCSCDCCLDGTCGEGGCEDCDCSGENCAVVAPDWDQSQTGTSFNASLLA